MSGQLIALAEAARRVGEVPGMHKRLLVVAFITGAVSPSMAQDAAPAEPPVAILPIAAFELPEGRDGFRAVAIEPPNVYATDSVGGVYSFKFDLEAPSQTVREHEFVQTKTGGCAIELLGNSILLPKRGQLHRFAINDLLRAEPVSILGEEGKWPTRAILRGPSQLFLLDPYRIVTYQLDGLDADPKITVTPDGSALWWCGCVRDGFVYAAKTSTTDDFMGISVLEIAADGALKQRGELKNNGMYVGVHAFGDHQLVLVDDLNRNVITLVDAANPDKLVRTRRLRFPTTRASVLARVHDMDVLVTGLAGAVLDGQEVIQVEYPYHTAGALDSACYFGDSQGEWVAIPADRVIHVVRIVPLQ